MTAAEILAAPFPLESLGFKAQTVKNNRALAVPYIDARDVMDRLDAAVGVENWRDEYTPLPDGTVLCTLSVRLGGEWVSKQDVGSMSDQPDAGDRMKSAVSDALKRAAVKFGVGRYLYSMPPMWCDYDPAKKQLTQTPPVPAKFLPRPAAATTAPEAKAAGLSDADVALLLGRTPTAKALASLWKKLPADQQARLSQAFGDREAEILDATAGATT